MTELGFVSGPHVGLYPPPHSVFLGIFSAQFWPAMNTFLNLCALTQAKSRVREDFTAGCPGLPDATLPLV